MTLPPICIDGRRVPGFATGVARYAANLRAALEGAGVTPIRLLDAPPDVALAQPAPGLLPLLGRAAAAARLDPRRAGLGPPDCFVAPDIYREAQRHFDLYGRTMPVELPGPCGIMHWTYPLPLHARGWRNLYTVHDLIPIMRPDLTAISRRRYARLLRAVTRRADRIVTVSATVRDDLTKWLVCPPERVVDCGQGIAAPRRFAEAPPEGVAPTGFLLAVGTIEPRKNLVRLIEAYRRSGSRRELLLVGPDGWRAGAIRAAAADTPGVRLLGFQPGPAVARLIRDATALLQPSLAEGFGMPVIEAMALGTPVLTADRGALGEVADTAALRVDPEDVDALAAAIRRLDTDAALRTGFASAGRERATLYDPARHAERLLALYRTETAALGHP